MADETQLSSELTRTITGSQEKISGKIDQIKLPFQDQLLRYVVAQEDRNGTAALLLDYMRDLLTALANLNIAVPAMLLDPTQYGVVYSSSFLDTLTAAILADLTTATTGIDPTVEADMWSRFRQRINREAARQTRMVIRDFSMRLPYAPFIADAMDENNDLIVDRMAEAAWQVTEKQADLTYQMARAKIDEAMKHVQFLADDYQKARDRNLNAYVKYDEIHVKSYFDYYAALMDRALGFVGPLVEYLTKLSQGLDNVTFQNYLSMSKLRADGELRIAGMVNQLQTSGQTLG